MTSARNVLITTRFFDENAREVLRAKGYQIYTGGVPYDGADSVVTDEMHTALSKCSAWIVGVAPVSKTLLEEYPHLELIARRGVGYDTIDVAAVKELGRVLTITPGSNEPTVADHTVGLMLSVGKRFFESHRRMQAGVKNVVVGTELYRKTVGLVGLGRIARQVVQRLRGFEVKLIAHDPFANERTAKELDIELVPLSELLAQSDFISLHAPLTPQTRHLINEETLSLLKPSAFVINTSRGELIDDAALLAALKSNKLAGAGLDVLGSEHDSSLLPITKELLEMPNVVCTQHTGGSSLEGLERANLLAVQCVLAVFEEKEMPDGCVVADARANNSQTSSVLQN